MSAGTLGGQTLNPRHLTYVPSGSSCGTRIIRGLEYRRLSHALVRYLRLRV